MQNAYDELGRAKGSTYVIGDATQTYGITYENITGLVKNYTTPGNSFTYTYDAFDRLSNKSGSRHAIAYTYVAGTQRVATYNFSQADATNITYSYTYDALGNITQIKKNGTTVSNYEYDSLGRLIREDDCTNSISWVYTYDNAGNLLKKYTFYGMTGIPASHLLSLHPYNGSEISSTYTYSSSAWGDLLTGYNGTEIEYDAIGNPLNWHNAASMLWDGRKLTYFSEDALDHGIAFAYNSDGIRTKKTLYDYDGSTITHNYILDGSTILKETITSGSGTSTLYYYYDESGISGLEYNGTKYTYVKNLQGDVIRIINANGVTVVEYNYDAWGNILSTTGSMASTLGATNPFRYRGYYYDTESGWYYLNSRYYDPLVGRFLNADTYVSTGQGLSGYNMFAYCLNAPVSRVDTAGTDSIRVTSEEDDNPLNDMGYISPGGGGAGGGMASALGRGLSTGVGGGMYGNWAGGVKINTTSIVATGAGLAVGAAGVAVANEITERIKKKFTERIHSVYVLKDSTGKVQYVGRTKNVSKRESAHKNNAARENLKMHVIASELTYAEARVLEQAAMLYYHTLLPGVDNNMHNQINGISPNHWKDYKTTFENMKKYIWNQVTNEILNWIEDH